MDVPSVFREYANKATPRMVLIVIYLRDLNSVIKMPDLSGFQRISQHLNESAPL